MAIQVDPHPLVMFAHDDRFHVGWWRTYAMEGHIAWGASLDRFAKTAKTPFASVVVVPAEFTETTPEERAVMAQMGDRTFERGGVTCVIMLARGFRAAVQRSVATTISLFVKSGRSLLVGEDLDEIIKKLPPGLAEHHAQLRAVHSFVQERVGTAHVARPPVDKRDARR